MVSLPKKWLLLNVKYCGYFRPPFHHHRTRCRFFLFHCDCANIWEIQKFYVLDVVKGEKCTRKKVEKLIFHFIDSVAGKTSYIRHIVTSPSDEMKKFKPFDIWITLNILQNQWNHKNEVMRHEPWQNEKKNGWRIRAICTKNEQFFHSTFSSLSCCRAIKIHMT